MRASPYDLTGLGLTPVPIETPQGRAQYATAQRAFAERAAALRMRLVAVCDRLRDDMDGPTSAAHPRNRSAPIKS